MPCQRHEPGLKRRVRAQVGSHHIFAWTLALVGLGTGCGAGIGGGAGTPTCSASPTPTAPLGMSAEVEALVRRATVPTPTSDAIDARNELLERRHDDHVDPHAHQLLLENSAKWVEAIPLAAARECFAAPPSGPAEAHEPIACRAIDAVRAMRGALARSAAWSGSLEPLALALERVSGVPDTCAHDESRLAAVAEAIRSRFALEHYAPRQVRVEYGSCVVASLSGPIVLSPDTESAVEAVVDDCSLAPALRCTVRVESSTLGEAMLVERRLCGWRTLETTLTRITDPAFY